MKPLIYTFIICMHAVLPKRMCTQGLFVKYLFIFDKNLNLGRDWCGLSTVTRVNRAEIPGVKLNALFISPS